MSKELLTVEEATTIANSFKLQAQAFTKATIVLMAIPYQTDEETGEAVAAITVSNETDEDDDTQLVGLMLSAIKQPGRFQTIFQQVFVKMIEEIDQQRQGLIKPDQNIIVPGL